VVFITLPILQQATFLSILAIINRNILATQEIHFGGIIAAAMIGFLEHGDSMHISLR
jgi:hypothetical protein